MTQSRGHRSVSMKLWVRSKNCEYSPGENWYSEQKREEPMDVIKRETPRLGSTGRHPQDTHVKQFGDEAGKLRISDSCSEIAVWWVLGAGSNANSEEGRKHIALTNTGWKGRQQLIEKREKLRLPRLRIVSRTAKKMNRQ